MIKAIIFDLDGVLIDADKWHFNALNVALQHSEIDPISWQEHLTIYKGIPTRVKLEILTQRKGLPTDLWPKIATAKQDITLDIINKFCIPDPEKIEMMRLLKKRYKVAVCSNAKRDTVNTMLELSKLKEFIDFSLSNEDVKDAKPSPQIYLKAFEVLGIRPDECVIVEDSDVGKQAATAAKGVLCSVAGPHEVNYYRVLNTVRSTQKTNIVIPAAGQGKRFAEVGYQHPKPLIDVEGRAMIELVLSNFSHIGKPIVLMQRNHIERYCADEILRYLYPQVAVVPVDGLTEGAACTALLARDLINNSNELILANSDQFLDIDISEFLKEMRASNADGGILTFEDNHPKWSYAQTGKDGWVTRVAEKEVISSHATVGVYYYRHGSDFVRYAEQMINKNIRVNNEFYVCPVFNEFVADGKKVKIYEIDKSTMHGLGTPEDLTAFLSNKKTTKILELDKSLDTYAVSSSALQKPRTTKTGSEESNVGKV